MDQSLLCSYRLLVLCGALVITRTIAAPCPAYLIFRYGAIRTLDYVLFDMTQVYGWWELAPLATPLSCTLYPHWEVLVH